MMWEDDCNPNGRSWCIFCIAHGTAVMNNFRRCLSGSDFDIVSFPLCAMRVARDVWVKEGTGSTDHYLVLSSST